MVRQCIGVACSVWRVKAKVEAACWGTFVTTLMWDLCGSVGGSGREPMSVSLGKHNKLHISIMLECSSLWLLHDLDKTNRGNFY